MSKKKKSESHPDEGEEKSSGKTITIIIILCFLGAMPILIWATLPESSPYTNGHNNIGDGRYRCI